MTLFALGEYQHAAVALNSFLSSAPGMDWTTMSSLYGNVDDYQVQLRKLEQFCTANPDDASAYFVLAYQYLVIGSKDAAIDALKVVVKNQPKDATAKRMLDALAPAPQTAAPAAAPAPASSDAPQTDLVGAWREGGRHDDRPDDYRGFAVHVEGGSSWQAGRRAQGRSDFHQ